MLSLPLFCSHAILRVDQHGVPKMGVSKCRVLCNTSYALDPLTMSYKIFWLNLIMYLTSPYTQSSFLVGYQSHTNIKVIF
jgi:hypothetical protein